MKKLFKRKSSSVSPEVKPDVIVLLNNMQQQLVFLEKKMDILIRQSSPQRFDRFPHHDKGKQHNSPRGRNFTQVICSDCKKECEVPFKPSGGRPVYCKECFSKRKDGSFDKRQEGEDRRPGKSRKPVFRRRKGRV